MLSGSFNTDAILNKVNGAASKGEASNSKLKVDVKSEEDVLDGYAHAHADSADDGGNVPGQTGSAIDATTWKREIDLLQELEKVPFGQTNDTVDKLSSEILSIVAAYRARQEQQQKAAKEAKDAIKEAKKAEQLAEAGGEPEAKKEKKQRAPRGSKKDKTAKVQETPEAAPEEMDIDSSEVDQLASDYEG